MVQINLHTHTSADTSLFCVRRRFLLANVAVLLTWRPTVIVNMFGIGLFRLIVS